MTTQSHPMPGGGVLRTHPHQWRTWPDWVNVVIAVYLVLAPLWTTGASAGWFITLGVLAVVVALWALGTVSSTGSESAQIVLGAVLFLSPWIGSFSSMASAAWTAWITGIALIVFAVVGMMMRKKLS